MSKCIMSFLFLYTKLCSENRKKNQLVVLVCDSAIRGLFFFYYFIVVFQTLSDNLKAIDFITIKNSNFCTI